MSNGPLIAVNLPIVTTGVRLVAKEMNLVVNNATPSFLFRNVREAVRLVPTSGKDVEGDLSANGVCETEVREGLLELGDHGGADVVLDVVSLVVVALLDGGVTANGGDVDHTVAELDKGTALDGDIEVGDVVEDPIANVVSVCSSVISQTMVVIGLGRSSLPTLYIMTYHLTSLLYLS